MLKQNRFSNSSVASETLMGYYQQRKIADRGEFPTSVLNMNSFTKIFQFGKVKVEYRTSQEFSANNSFTNYFTKDTTDRRPSS